MTRRQPSHFTRLELAPRFVCDARWQVGLHWRAATDLHWPLIPSEGHRGGFSIVHGTAARE